MRLIRVVFTGLVVMLPVTDSRARRSALSKALESAEQFDLYSLNPEQRDEKDGFHGWKVLGKTTIKDAATRKQLVEAFREGRRRQQGHGRILLHPALRHSFDEGRQDASDLVICFQCMQVKDYVGDKAGKRAF